MDDGIDFVFLKDRGNGSGIRHICLIKPNLFPGDFLNPLKNMDVAVIKVIHDHDLVTGIQKLHTGMAADISGTART